jgi:dipeptidyl aminopeptidase/acylaminoacyl peptidase
VEAPWRQRFRATRLGFPSWARDAGDRVVYISNESGKFEVYTWDRERGARRRLTDRPEGTGYRVPPQADPKGEHVFWFDDAKGNELGHWRREPFAGGVAAVVAADLAPAYSARLAVGRSLSVLGRSRDGEGSTIFVLRDGAGPRRVYAHPQNAHVAGLSRDETLIAISHSEHGDARNPALRILDPAGAPLAELWDGPGKGLEVERWSPVAGDQRLLVQHEREGLSRPLIFDAATRSETVIDLDLPGETFADWYADASALLVGHDHRGRSELYRYVLATRRLERLPTEPGTIGAARARPDGDVWYHWTNAATPAEIRSLRGGVVLRSEETAPAGALYADYEVAGIHGYVAKPSGSGPHPTFFFIHGGPEAHDRDMFSATVQAWVDHGFAVVLVNYRGSSGYGKAWRDAIVGNPGLTELEDIAKVQDWAIATGLADPRRCLFGGGSWGGYLTLLALGTQPERWALGLASIPVGDYVAAYEDEMEQLKKSDDAFFGGSPTEVPERYQRANPITYVERVRVPVLMLVGLNDPRCPPRSVAIYEERLGALGTSFETYRYDAGHGSLLVEEQVRQVERQIAFAAKHLGTTAPIG